MTKKTVAKDSALAEITLRRYEKPFDMKRRELVKKLCLSIGLLQPGDSRDVIVDVLLVLLNAKSEKVLLSSVDVRKEVVKLRTLEKLDLNGIADSNIRRQLRRLKNLFLVEKVEGGYRISEFENLKILFEEKIERFYLNSILERVKDYFSALE